MPWHFTLLSTSYTCNVHLHSKKWNKKNYAGLSPDFRKILRITLEKLNMTLRLGYFPRQKYLVGSIKQKSLEKVCPVAAFFFAAVPEVFGSSIEIKLLSMASFFSLPDIWVLFYFITSIIWSTAKLPWLGAIQLLPQSVKDSAGTCHGQTLVNGVLEMLMYLRETFSPSALPEAHLIYFFVSYGKSELVRS